MNKPLSLADQIEVAKRDIAAMYAAHSPVRRPQAMRDAIRHAEDLLCILQMKRDRQISEESHATF